MLFRSANYAKPTKANDTRRIFMDSENRYQFQNLSNTILGAYRATSAEFFGNVYAILVDNSQNDKYLMTSHRDFSYFGGPAFDFRSYDNNVKQIYIAGSYSGNSNVGSVGWFTASDTSTEIDHVCVFGTYINLYCGDEVRLECAQYNQNDVAFNSGVSDDEFYDRLYGEIGRAHV